jgi:hypothetical protein
MILIVGMERLMERFKRSLLQNKAVSSAEQAEDAVRFERELIRKARRGR